MLLTQGVERRGPSCYVRFSLADARFRRQTQRGTLNFARHAEDDFEDSATQLCSFKTEIKYQGPCWNCYWISSSPRPVCGQGDGWFSCGTVCEVEPSKRTIDIVRFECARTFADQAAAVNHGLEVARKWVDENAESFRQSSRRWIGRTPCPCKRSGSN